jgi:hypothetical protein
MEEGLAHLMEEEGKVLQAEEKNRPSHVLSY